MIARTPEKQVEHDFNGVCRRWELDSSLFAELFPLMVRFMKSDSEIAICYSELSLELISKYRMIISDISEWEYFRVFEWMTMNANFVHE